MARSHPPTLSTLVEGTLRRECELPIGATLVLGVSGGPDSMALCHVLHALRESLRFRLVVVSIDHGLRAESAAEVRLVEAFCEAHALEFHTRRLSLTSGGNLQERAREARYAALRQLADDTYGPDAFLVTAHHKEDRAETVLLRLLRGTSLAGLRVLSPQSERILRPMIRARRSDVLLHVERHKIPHVTDPSNGDSRFLRTRVRTELLPLLADLGPGIVDHLVELADEAAEHPEALGLNREQRRQFRQALRDRTLPVNLRLPGGLVLSRQTHKKNVEE